MNLSSVLILTMLVLGSQAVPMERERRQADADAAVDPNVPESKAITSELADVPAVPDAKEPAVEKQEAEVKPDESAKKPEAITSELADVPAVPDAKEPAVEKQEAEVKPDESAKEPEAITSALAHVPAVPDAKEPAVEKQESEVKPDESAKEPEPKLDKAAKEPEAKQEEPEKEPEVKQEKLEKVPEAKQAEPKKVPEAKQPETVVEQKLGDGIPVDEGPISNDIIEDSKKVKEQPEDVKKPANHDPTSADNDGILGIPRAIGNTINTLAGSWDNILIVFNNLMRFLGLNRD